jgi:hypothetical protein
VPVRFIVFDGSPDALAEAAATKHCASYEHDEQDYQDQAQDAFEDERAAAEQQDQDQYQ